MSSDEYVEERQALLRTVERDEEELREAVEDIRRAAKRPLAFVSEVAQRPGPWLLCGLLLGIWWGARPRS